MAAIAQESKMESKMESKTAPNENKKKKKMNPFAVMDKNKAIEKGIFSGKNTIYFPNGSNRAIPYNKILNEKQINIIAILNFHLLEHFKNIEEEAKAAAETKEKADVETKEKADAEAEDGVYGFKDLEKLRITRFIFRCARELLYEKLRQLDNFADPMRIRIVTAACWALAAKMVLAYDWESIYPIDFANYHLKQQYIFGGTVPLYESIESDLLKTTDWRGCAKVNKRTGNIPSEDPKEQHNLVLQKVKEIMGGRKKKRKTRRKIRRKKRKTKHKKCSKKRLRKKMLCLRGTKKNLKKIARISRKYKLRLTRCSKKRLSK